LGGYTGLEFYALRIYGYICIPTTGEYTFWIAADDIAEFRLSTNSDPANATVRAYAYSWTPPYAWDKMPGQRSAPIYLIGGQRYYFEVMHRQNYGGDTLAVAWQGPGITRQVVPRHVVTRYND
jgi:PA14 domain